jgi:predicted CXXCH cytochrome family protein
VAPRRWLRIVPFVLAVPVAAAVAKPHGTDVHRADADCRVCHTLDGGALRADPAAARAALVPDLEARCAGCHGDEGPSHKTGIRPVRAEPPTLPLAADGTIACTTCHYMHGEKNDFGDFLRLDNRRGGLCLSCHELSELQ